MDLTVKPVKQKDAGRGLAILSRGAVERLGAEAGDYVILEGPLDDEIARVWPGYPEDDGSRVVRVDGTIRRAIGVDLDDDVTVTKAEMAPAASVDVALDEHVQPSEGFRKHVRHRLSGRPVMEEEELAVRVDGSDGTVELRILEVVPSSPAIVTATTDVRISDRPYDCPRGEETEAESRGSGPVFSEVLPPPSDVYDHPVAVVTLSMVVLTVVVGGSLALAEYTSTSFRNWLQTTGTLVIVLLSATTLWYHLSK